MTDHGNIFGAVQFVTKRKEAASSRSWAASFTSARKTTIAHPPEGDTYNHLLVLAENEEGYRNLVKITSEAAARLLLQAAHQQEISGGAFQRADRPLRLPEGRSRRAADGREVRRGPRRGQLLSRHLRQREFLPRNPGPGTARRSTAFMPTCSSWKKISACRWWRPTTATTCAKTMRTRRT